MPDREVAQALRRAARSLATLTNEVRRHYEVKMPPVRRRPAVLLVGVIAVLLTASACTGGGSDTASGDPTPATESPSLPAAISVPLEDRLVADIALEGGPDYVLGGFGSVWVRGDGQKIVEIDPRTNKVLEEIRLDIGFCQGLAIGFGRVWTCSDDHLVAFNPRTGRREVRSKEVMNPNQALYGMGAGSVWILSAEDLGATLKRVDPATGDTTALIPLGHICKEVIYGAGSVWVACSNDGMVLRIDPDTEEVVQEIEGLPKAAVMSQNGGYLWVATFDGAGQVARIEIASGEVKAVEGTLGADTIRSIVATDEAVWVRQNDILYSRINLEGVVEENVSSGTADEDEGSITFAVGDLWVTQNDQARLLRLSP